ncbi:MAG: hypothetical protein IPH16_19810 [Haliscomenobacter sp.]|nr:hypothetical protein [Haliscomenobacter sp.]
MNFYIGLETIQGFTRGRRDWQFDLQQPYTGARLDLLLGNPRRPDLAHLLRINRKIWY